MDFLEEAGRLASQDSPLLLTGESGTGKSRLARLIHGRSPRRGQPLRVVDCTTFACDLLDSELFGRHIEGAFCGACRGTLLLEDVRALPLHLQGTLLRVIERVESEPAQPRVVATSGVPLEGEAQAGRFRRDLAGRLARAGLHLPPLRERRQALAPLAARFLGQFVGRNRPDVTGFTPEALAALERYDWPGNVRELRTAVERAVALCRGPEVGLVDLPIRKGAHCSPAPAAELLAT
jgi:DNA-binding NtrC family response regulator